MITKEVLINCYSAVASNYDKPLSYREILRLVDFKDYEGIVDLVIDSIPMVQKELSNQVKHF